MMYFTVQGKVRAIQLATGRSLWTYRPRVGTDGQYHLVGSDVAVWNGTVYAAGNGSDTVYVLNAATGRERWWFRAGLRHGDFSDVAIAYGHVFVGEAGVPPDDEPQTGVGSKSGLYCLSGPTGRVLWRFRDNPGFGMGPSVANGVVYAADDFTGRVFTLRASNGQMLWSARVSRSGVAGNTVVTDGMVLVNQLVNQVHVAATRNRCEEATDDRFVLIGGHSVYPSRRTSVPSMIRNVVDQLRGSAFEAVIMPTSS